MKNPLFKKVLGVDLIGGEPLLNKEIFSIIKYLSKNNYFTNINTNGLRLTDCISELKKSGLSRISISLYDDKEDYTIKNYYADELPVLGLSLINMIYKKNLNKFFGLINLSFFPIQKLVNYILNFGYHYLRIYHM